MTIKLIIQYHKSMCQAVRLLILTHQSTKPTIAAIVATTDDTQLYHSIDSLYQR